MLDNFLEILPSWHYLDAMNKYQWQQIKNNLIYHIKKTPTITKYLLISLFVIYLLTHVVNLSFFVLKSFGNGFNPITLVSYAFLHYSFAHFFFNALAIWLFGREIEEYWGEKRYLIYVFVCIIGAGLLHLLFSNAAVVGISGLVFGLLLAFGMMWPNREIFLLLPPMPIKAKYMVMGYGALLMFDIFANSHNGIANFAHLGGALSGFLLIQYWRKKPPFRF